MNYAPLNRSYTQSGLGGFDPFTYGQDVPGAQTAEYEFFQPYNNAGIGQTYVPPSVSQRYTQADVDAAREAQQSAYNTGLSNFTTYQNDLASQVEAGSMTPQEAQAAAQQYASGLGFETTAPVDYAALAAPVSQKEGGEAGGDEGMSEDMVRHLVEWHKGGGHTGPGQVKGIGSGQEDLIPAWLSDGEYVWSAQDVADLGDGSTDEGVRRLDKMRQMVRRRAGRKDVKKIAKPQQGIDAILKAVGGPV